MHRYVDNEVTGYVDVGFLTLICAKHKNNSGYVFKCKNSKSKIIYTYGYRKIEAPFIELYTKLKMNEIEGIVVRYGI
jgi:hypothetical protein